MRSLIFRTTARYLVPILFLFSVLLLFRGHDHPGGGFPAALVAGIALAIQGLTRHEETLAELIRLEAHLLMAAGLSLMILSGLPGLIVGGHFLESQWIWVGINGGLFEWLGTPLLFDIGVVTSISGGGLLILASLPEEW